MHPLLRHTDHRTAPLPDKPWVMLQNWHDLVFAHWALAPEQLQPLIPEQLALDLYDGKAYVAVTPFWMSGVRARGLPAIPRVSRFPELNVRTYVRYGNIPGVYFFSLDAGSRAAVKGARWGYQLPYFYAEMTITNIGPKLIYSSRRLEGPQPAEFRGRYWPTSAPRRREKSGREHFLTERYCLYTVNSRKVYRAYIHHLPWPLQDAEGDIEANTMTEAAGIELPPSKPLLHFSRTLEVLIWWPERA
jgi:uncharacterized protein YqjF (DUF2071 family)